MTQSIQKSAAEHAVRSPADTGNAALDAELSVGKLRLHGMMQWYVIAATLAAIFASVNQLFNLRLGNYTMLEGQYLYILAGLFLSVTFVSFRVDGKASAHAPWYDWILALASLIVAVYFVATASESLDSGWEYAAPQRAVVFSVALYVLVLEATRRAGGWVLFGIVATFSLYPTFAGSMPDPLSGFQSPFLDVVPYFMISSEASFGIPMNAFGNLVIGFVLFGAILQFTGGGKFFNNLALALVGQFRGGAAKVAIFASGFMGSMSGSVISNVLTTGAVSIPAMKRTGFSARYAAATEACASTGGVLMPPIMGATAFVMAAWLSRPYVDIMMAAAVPSILYYFGLFVQIDAYAARNDLRGLPRTELPRLKETMRGGWQYIVVFAVLIFLMVAFRWETTAPFYAIVLLLVINQFSHHDRFTRQGFMDMIVSVGRTLGELTAIVLGIGIIVGSFQATGLTGPLATELIFMAGDNVFVLLVMGAITSFVFGMGMPVTACYIFLAVVLAPTLVQAGLNELAVHLFILYWGMVSFITPPVAIGAFGAASLAGASPMRTGVEAMRLGGVIYIVPFFFVLNPALIGEGTFSEMAILFVGALIGIWLISAALQGYVSFFGALPDGAKGVVLRVLLFGGGMLIAAPTGDAFGLLHLAVSGAGVALAILPLAAARRNHAPVAAAAE
ncbi:TRAP transporter fused permease subunit [Rhodobacteraceae bacterium F11138]|nr:TRAP transporter fused permease subunit [Rhodobacteraceae bacterium F11138]